MANFKEMSNAPVGSKFILQGNTAFALGVIGAGYHAADGYPGTPSTEVIDKGLALVQDKIQVGWSVNEAVAYALAIGRSIAGHDTVVTMKVPGVFQAGDAITTSAFYTGSAGALVIYVASDYVPSSTQHVIDARYFFASSRIPVLEPKDHQQMYDIAWHAADMSREFNTPVVVLASGILAHSEGIVVTKKTRKVSPRELPPNLHDWMLLPKKARDNYNRVNLERIPGIQKKLENSQTLVHQVDGSSRWGIITSGASTTVVKEALAVVGANPSLLSVTCTYPIPEKSIRSFAEKISGKIFVIEDGDKFLQEKIQLLGIEVIGKKTPSVLTHWTPEAVINLLAENVDIKYNYIKRNTSLQPVNRPPAICPGCPYRAFGQVVSKLKKQKKLYASFGDIGCSTLLYFLDAIDTVLCMGASDSIRQGMVLSRPDMSCRTISVIGDSCECHSGLDSTRNAVFRNVAGVKVILDNQITAMTGGQRAPSSNTNLANESNRFNLQRVVSAENERTIVVEAFDVAAIEKELKQALKLAEKGEFSTLIIEGPCISEIDNSKKMRQVELDYNKCKLCGLCDICPGIELDENKRPSFTNMCTNCGSNSQVCMQKCPFNAIVSKASDKLDTGLKLLPLDLKELNSIDQIDKSTLPESLRLAIRGIGGQGNLFFGKVLSKVFLNTPYCEDNIVKGDTHGMAQLGGAVISTFSCGNVHSSIPAPGSFDVLVVMESSEVLRPGFLNLLKPDGVVLLNQFSVLPPNVKLTEYPQVGEIEKMLTDINLIKINALEVARGFGDEIGMTSNVVVLGLLSTIAPFNLIPENVWLNALMSLSPNERFKSANFTAFKEGRKYDR
ncbi:MAG: 2-oxoacid:acceptor oxidoreductase family protein [Bacteriovoracaceae bacterium]|nr:2-oxoacid:acceptor oxidoreductase family protein [Bacteriovoracaceae bacterium]